MPHSEPSRAGHIDPAEDPLSGALPSAHATGIARAAIVCPPELAPSLRRFAERLRERAATIDRERPRFAHQDDSLHALADHLEAPLDAGPNSCFARLATRGGKSRVGVEVAAAIGERTVIGVPTRVLRTHWLRELESWAPELSVGTVKHPGRDVVVDTYNKLVRAERSGELDLSKFSLYIPDEAHTARSTLRMRLAEQVRGHGLVFALTATPYTDRLNNCELSFGRRIIDLSLSEAMLRKLVLSCEYSAHYTGIDISGVRLSAGDFSKRDLARSLRNTALFRLAVDTYTELDYGIPSVFFVARTEQAKELSRMLNAAGVRSAAIFGRAKNAEDDLKRFDAGELDALVAVRTLAVGWNNTRVSAVYNVTPTMRPVLLEHRSARCLTPDPSNPGKSPRIREFVYIDGGARQILFPEIVSGEALAIHRSEPGSRPRTKAQAPSAPRLELRPELDFIVIRTPEQAKRLVESHTAKRTRIPPDWLTFDEAADRLGTPVRIVERYVRNVVKVRTPEDYSNLVIGRSLSPVLFDELKELLERLVPPHGYTALSDLKVGTSIKAQLPKIASLLETHLVQRLSGGALRWYASPDLIDAVYSVQKPEWSKDTVKRVQIGPERMGPKAAAVLDRLLAPSPLAALLIEKLGWSEPSVYRRIPLVTEAPAGFVPVVSLYPHDMPVMERDGWLARILARVKSADEICLARIEPETLFVHENVKHRFLAHLEPAQVKLMERYHVRKPISNALLYSLLDEGLGPLRSKSFALADVRGDALRTAFDCAYFPDRDAAEYFDVVTKCPKGFVPLITLVPVNSTLERTMEELRPHIRDMDELKVLEERDRATFLISRNLEARFSKSTRSDHAAPQRWTTMEDAAKLTGLSIGSIEDAASHLESRSSMQFRRPFRVGDHIERDALLTIVGLAAGLRITAEDGLMRSVFPSNERLSNPHLFHRILSAALKDVGRHGSRIALRAKLQPGRDGFYYSCDPSPFKRYQGWPPPEVPPAHLRMRGEAISLLTEKGISPGWAAGLVDIIVKDAAPLYRGPSGPVARVRKLIGEAEASMDAPSRRR